LIPTTSSDVLPGAVFPKDSISSPSDAFLGSTAQSTPQTSTERFEGIKREVITNLLDLSLHDLNDVNMFLQARIKQLRERLPKKPGIMARLLVPPR